MPHYNCRDYVACNENAFHNVIWTLRESSEENALFNGYIRRRCAVCPFAFVHGETKEKRRTHRARFINYLTIGRFLGLWALIFSPFFYCSGNVGHQRAFSFSSFSVSLSLFSFAQAEWELEPVCFALRLGFLTAFFKSFKTTLVVSEKNHFYSIIKFVLEEIDRLNFWLCVMPKFYLYFWMGFDPVFTSLMKNYLSWINFHCVPPNAMINNSLSRSRYYVWTLLNKCNLVGTNNEYAVNFRIIHIIWIVNRTLTNLSKNK